MKNFNFKLHALPHIIAVAVFYLLVLFYFSDAATGNKVLSQGDSIQWSGASKETWQHREQFSEEPLWTNSMFGGMPTYTISTIYSGDLLEGFQTIISVGLPYPVSIIFISLLCFYATLLCFRVNPYVAMFGAVSFTFFSFNFISLEAGHNSKLLAMVYAPLIVGGFHLLSQRKWLLGFLVAAIGSAMHIRSGHYQITYYVGLIMGIMVLFYIINALKEKQLKVIAPALGLLLVAGALGIGASAGRLMTIQEYSKYSMRGKAELTPKDANKPTDGGLDRDYVFSWSHEPLEVLTLALPSIYGGSSGEPINKKGELAKVLRQNNVDPSQVGQAPMYWGSMPFTSGPIYAGIVVIFLFVVGLVFLEGKFKWWLLTATLLSIFLSMGKFFPALNFALYDYFPFYNKFRTVTMSIYIAQLCMPLMAALALQKLSEMEWEAAQLKKLYISGGVVAGICLLFFIAPSIAGDFSSEKDAELNIPNWFIDALVSERENALQQDALRNLFFVVLALGAVWASAKFKLNALVLASAITVLSLADLWLVDKRYLNKDNFKKKTEMTAQESPSEADLLIMQNPVKGRVLNMNNPFNETKTSTFHQSIGGYSPAKIRRYQDLIENDLSIEIQDLIAKLNSGKFDYDSLKAFNVINMLNTRYIKLEESARGVLVNPYAMGNAWFVNTIDQVKTPDEEIAKLPSFNVRSTAVVDVVKFPIKEFSYSLDSSASIKLMKYKANELVYESNNAAKGFAVFSEIYYPAGWVATIDGNEVPILRANYALRALEVPAGKHSIVFKFQPSSYTTGNSIMMASSSLIWLLILGVIGLSVKDILRKKE